jgi:spore germination protein GerM
MNRLIVPAGAALVLALAGCTPTGPAQPSASPPTATASETVTATASPSTTATATPTASPSGAATRVVTVYFDNGQLNPDAADCGQVYGVPREIPNSDDVLTATLEELLAGPTAAEKAQGYTSWFSDDTKDALLSAEVSGGTSYVDLDDLRTTIPNASTSCGSEALLAQLTTTAQQAGLTPRVLYAIEGEPRTFWEWLQMGCDASNDNCDPTPFA